MSDDVQKEIDNFISTEFPKGTLSHLAFERAIQQKILFQVNRQDLFPVSSKNALFNHKDSNGHLLPIYVACNCQGPTKAELMHTKDGKSYILINEGYHRWTSEYVRYLGISDANLRKDAVDLKDAATLVKPEYRASITKLAKTLDRYIREKAHDMGVSIAHVGVTYNGSSAVANSYISAEEHNYFDVDLLALTGVNAHWRE